MAEEGVDGFPMLTLALTNWVQYMRHYLVTLYEVKKADTNPTELENAYFVSESQLVDYKQEERVFNKDGTIRKYLQGTFIYRLAGRDREKSASYYTPEVLTKSLVKYALKELLEIDDHGKIGKTADEIIKLTVCEPAMGSAAFLNEAINQLSEAYLQQKQLESGERIPHDKYVLERQKVKMYIADNNVFGVDLNTTAVELAEISLWLNALFADDTQTFIPWFRLQLINGNSLIGARRQVYEVTTLSAKNKDLLWYNYAPKRLKPESLWPTRKYTKASTISANNQLFANESELQLEVVTDKITVEKSAGRLVENQVYHFLLADPGMANYNDKIIKALKPEEFALLKQWNKSFTQVYNDKELKTLLKLSTSIDKLWQEHTRHQAEMRKKVSDPIKVWGQPTSQYNITDLKFKDRVIEQERNSEKVKNSSPYRRLKMVMDYWCSLWFWPIDKANLLPTRGEFLEDISKLVDKRSDLILNLDKDLFSETITPETMREQLDELGFIDVDEQVRNNSRLQVVSNVSQANKFLHWELEFADIFSKKGGFDLILGNPPWLKVEWNESGIMGEANPLFDIRKFSAAKLNELRTNTFEQYSNLMNEYIGEYESAFATQSYLNAISNYAILKGSPANLYKCFLPQGWMLASYKGVCGFFHPEGVYDDPDGGVLRSEIYKRLKYHFQYINELSLFPEVDSRVLFSTNIYKNGSCEVSFITVANIFIPQTIDASFIHSGIGVVVGIKDDKNNRNMTGHRDRLIRVTVKELELFAKLYDDSNTPALEARLPALHASNLITILEKLSRYPALVSNYKPNYYSTPSTCWNETTSQEIGIIERCTTFPNDIRNLIISGPHFIVGNPLYKTPRNECTSSSQYDVIDLTIIKDDYLPRTNYLPKSLNFNNLIPTVSFSNGTQKVTDFYRIAFRGMVGFANERSLIGAIIPKYITHIHGVRSIAFSDNKYLIALAVYSGSLVADFFLKSTGKTNLHYTWETFPLITTNLEMKSRVLSLTSLTKYFSDLHQEQYLPDFNLDSWTKSNDQRLNQHFFANLTPIWQRKVALRTDYERRQALVEIDVLVALELGLTLDDLKNIYRIQFSVLRQNENETYYDMRGRIVFTVSKGLTGVGVERAIWNDIKDMLSGTFERKIMDDTEPGGPVERIITYYAPFAKCYREEDYAIAWAAFSARGLAK